MNLTPKPRRDTETLEAVRQTEVNTFIHLAVGSLRKAMNPLVGKTPSETLRNYLRLNSWRMDQSTIDAMNDAVAALADSENDPRRAGCYGERHGGYVTTRMVRR